MLSYKVINKELTLLDSLKLKDKKTKTFLEIMKNLKLDKSTLFVTTDLSEELLLGTRNIKGVKVINPTEVNVLDLVSYEKLVVTEEALKVIEEVLV